MTDYIEASKDCLRKIHELAKTNDKLTIVADGALFTPYFSKYRVFRPTQPIADLSGWKFITLGGVFVNSFNQALWTNDTKDIITVSDFVDSEISGLANRTMVWNPLWDEYCGPLPKCTVSVLMRLAYGFTCTKLQKGETLKDACKAMCVPDNLTPAEMVSRKWFKDVLDAICSGDTPTPFVDMIYDICVNEFDGMSKVCNLISYAQYFKYVLNIYGRQYRNNCLRNTVTILHKMEFLKGNADESVSQSAV